MSQLKDFNVAGTSRIRFVLKNLNMSSHVCWELSALSSAWVPSGFPRKKWVPFINMHNGRVNDIIYCYNLGFLHTNEVSSYLGKNGFLHTNKRLSKQWKQ